MSARAGPRRGPRAGRGAAAAAHVCARTVRRSAPLQDARRAAPVRRGASAGQHELDQAERAPSSGAASARGTDLLGSAAVERDGGAAGRGCRTSRAGVRAVRCGDGGRELRSALARGDVGVGRGRARGSEASWAARWARSWRPQLCPCVHRASLLRGSRDEGGGRRGDEGNGVGSEAAADPSRSSVSVACRGRPRALLRRPCCASRPSRSCAPCGPAGAEREAAAREGKSGVRARDCGNQLRRSCLGAPSVASRVGRHEQVQMLLKLVLASRASRRERAECERSGARRAGEGAEQVRGRAAEARALERSSPVRRMLEHVVEQVAITGRSRDEVVDVPRAGGARSAARGQPRESCPGPGAALARLQDASRMPGAGTEGVTGRWAARRRRERSAAVVALEGGGGGRRASGRGAPSSRAVGVRAGEVVGLGEA